MENEIEHQDDDSQKPITEDDIIALAQKYGAARSRKKKQDYEQELHTLIFLYGGQKSMEAILSITDRYSAQGFHLARDEHDEPEPTLSMEDQIANAVSWLRAACEQNLKFSPEASGETACERSEHLVTFIYTNLRRELNWHDDSISIKKVLAQRSLPDGSMEYHCWVEIDDLIVDISADRFEDRVSDPIIITRDRAWHDAWEKKG